MATSQKFRMGIIEGDIYIFGKAGEAMECHDVVALDTANAGKFIKCGTSDVPFGFVAEKVTVNGVQDYEPGGLVSHTAKVGDYVGVYINGGVYNHAQTGLPYGALVYAVAGKCVTGASSNGTPVGLVVAATDSTTGLAKIKSLL
jgi:hypothetical protein